MNVASLELCRELYELNGWKLPKVGSGWWFTYPDGEQVLFASERPEHWDEAVEKVPAYDLGYLLRKLPRTDKEDIYAHATVATIRKDDFACYWESDTGEYYTSEGQTPEDAAAKLAIELFKQGILKREGRE